MARHKRACAVTRRSSLGMCKCASILEEVKRCEVDLPSLGIKLADVEAVEDMKHSS